MPFEKLLQDRLPMCGSCARRAAVLGVVREGGSLKSEYIPMLGTPVDPFLPAWYLEKNPPPE